MFYGFGNPAGAHWTARPISVMMGRTNQYSPMSLAMFGWTARCPVCTSANCRRSQSGWVRYLTRPVFLFPVRCRHCQTRFWRFTLSPPPVGRPQRKAQAHLPADPPSDEPAPHAAARPAHG